MGGDDLDGDAQFLNPLANVDDDDEEDVVLQKQTEKKRKREEKENNDEIVPTKKKPSMKQLIQSGRDLHKETAIVQAKFLLSSVRHHSQMKGNGNPENIKIDKSRLLQTSSVTMIARLKDVVSMKKLKKWQPIGSPMVIILCISARRVVEVLKELSALKVRIAKLFAKHMDINEQKRLLSQQSFGLAVGTPNRILALCNNDVKDLSFEKTSHIILDTHTNQKGFTVCTLPDTAPDTMEIIEKKILPELSRRRDIKISFL
mmetsp:Transcript_17315/g.19981  ORF Transcript_17315/g.19981 Transcript_17315/m.19981 type:complete len:259 (+) Transcript_17315:67-843(+)